MAKKAFVYKSCKTDLYFLNPILNVRMRTMAKIQDQNYCKLSETLTAKSILSALKKKAWPTLIPGLWVEKLHYFNIPRHRHNIFTACLFSVTHILSPVLKTYMYPQCYRWNWTFMK